MIAACEPRALILARSTPLAEVAPLDAAVFWLNERPADDRLEFCTLARPSRAASLTSGPSEAAYLLFTSGSTGMPKGVVVNHASVIRFVEWAVKYAELGSGDRLSGHPPLHFDLSMLDLFGAFAAGAQLHLVPPEVNIRPHGVAEFIREHRLTQWFSVPSVLTYAAKFDAVQPGDFPTLKRVLWCGEVLPTPTLMYWMRRLSHVRFTNLYGPTETTIASSYYPVDQCPQDPAAPIPIGTACPGEDLLVLDETGRPVLPGHMGELYIGGCGLSPGYWRDPERTRAAFVPHPLGPDPSTRLYRTGDMARVGDDGLVYFLGRKDTQIKCRGYRIELGEIEAALHTIPGVYACAVVAVPSQGFEGVTICCAYVPAPGASLTPIEARRHLGAVLPPHMVPLRWMVFERLPYNANGKIDRQQVAEAFRRDGHHDGHHVGRPSAIAGGVQTP